MVTHRKEIQTSPHHPQPDSEIHPEADTERKRILKSQRNVLQLVRRRPQIGKPVVKILITVTTITSYLLR